VADPRSSEPIARSPIAALPPVAVVDGWEISQRRSSARLRLADRTPLAKILVRAEPSSPAAMALGVGFGRCARRADRVLVVGSGPGEWLLIGPPNTAPDLAAGVPGGNGTGPVSVVDVTHGRAMVRLSGPDAARALAKLCAIDLRERVTPDGAAFRSMVANVSTDVVRDDRDGVPSYLLHCERSSGQYLFDALLDACAEFGGDVDGFDLR
jgi:sarcosine oxidase, subunit alpha